MAFKILPRPVQAAQIQPRQPKVRSLPSLASCGPIQAPRLGLRAPKPTFRTLYLHNVIVGVWQCQSITNSKTVICFTEYCCFQSGVGRCCVQYIKQIITTANNISYTTLGNVKSFLKMAATLTNMPSNCEKVLPMAPCCCIDYMESTEQKNFREQNGRRCLYLVLDNCMKLLFVYGLNITERRYI